MVEKISNLQARERKSQELFAFTDPFPLSGYGREWGQGASPSGGVDKNIKNK